MPRPKGSPNKLTSIIKDKLGDILSEAIESLKNKLIIKINPTSDYIFITII